MAKKFIWRGLTAIILTIGLSAPVAAQELVYASEWAFGCMTPRWFVDTFDFMMSGDKASLQAYVDSGKCKEIEQGQSGTLVGSRGLMQEIIIEGERLWTFRAWISRTPPPSE